MNKESFVAQFKHNIDVSNIKHILVKDSVWFGVQTYRALNKIIIEVDGNYYCS